MGLGRVCLKVGWQGLGESWWHLTGLRRKLTIDRAGVRGGIVGGLYFSRGDYPPAFVSRTWSHCGRAAGGSFAFNASTSVPTYSMIAARVAIGV